MGIIKDRFKVKADQWHAEIKELVKEHGNKKIGEVQLSQVYQGMRGMTGLVTETLCSMRRKVSVSGDILSPNCRKNFPKPRWY